MELKCLLDMDGVITDFVRGTCRLFGWPYIYEPGLGNFGEPEIQKIMNISKTRLFRDMEYEFWRDLPKMHDADEIVNLIEPYFGIKNICILTSPTYNIGCFVGKRKWIELNFPQFKKQMLVGAAKHFCAAPNHVLIDDRLKNCQNFLDAGGKTIMVPRPWNHMYHNSEDVPADLKEQLLSL